MSYLLDTNVVSEIRKPNSNPGVAAWFGEAESAELYLSVLVVGEVRQGIERLLRRRDRKQADVFERWLTVLKQEFVDRVLPISVAVAERWGRLNAVRPLPVIHGLLARRARARSDARHARHGHAGGERHSPTQSLGRMT